MQTLPMLGCFSILKFKKNISSNFIYIYLLLLIFFIGFKHDTGGDWIQYLHNYENPLIFSLVNLSIRSDYLYNYLAFLFYSFGLNFYFFNLLLAVFFVLCLFYFCQLFKSISLAFVFSFPIIIMIMGLGFTRQGIAFAFVLIAIISFIKQNKVSFILWMIIAILFHKSSIVMLLFYPLISSKINYFEIFFLFLLLIIIIFLLKSEFLNLYNNYIGSNLYNNAESGTYLESKGAIFRVGLNCIAAVIFLFLMNELTENNNEKKIFFMFSIISFVCLILVFKYSVFIDRFNYYLTPLQVFVYSRLPFFFNNLRTQEFFKISLSFLHIAILFVWINFAENSHAWLPYQNILVEWIIK